MSDVPSYPVVQKTPAEAKLVAFDFAAELESGTTLTGPPTITVDEGAPTTPAIAAAAPTLDAGAPVVRTLVSGGAMGDVARVAARCASSDGQTHEIAAVVQIAPVN